MNFWTAAVLIVLVLSVVRVLEARYRSHGGNHLRPADDADLRQQLADLHDRVRVLERIVTDRSHDLAGEIEALRDSPLKPPGA